MWRGKEAVEERQREAESEGEERMISGAEGSQDAERGKAEEDNNMG